MRAGGFGFPRSESEKNDFVAIDFKRRVRISVSRRNDARDNQASQTLIRIIRFVRCCVAVRTEICTGRCVCEAILSEGLCIFAAQ